MPERSARTEHVDIAIIGAGINGAGIARDAAGRGFSVLLVDKGDIGGATSSASSKLIHGGLRYLEHGDWRLVAEALRERTILLKIAPHIVQPLQFVLPYAKQVMGGKYKAPLLVRLGLMFYDFLARSGPLPKSARAGAPVLEPLKSEFRHGYTYYDCKVDDARLVLLNALDASERGAIILPRTECVSATPGGDKWHITLRNDKGESTVTAKTLVNAAGPFVNIVEHQLGKAPSPMKFVRGSHIIVPQMFSHSAAYILPQEDGRVVFAIPYANNTTMLGTTEVDVGTDVNDNHMSDAECQYMLNAAGRYFKHVPQTILHHFAGIRALVADGSDSLSSISREYTLKQEGTPPVLHVLGGKLTTYRSLAVRAMEHLAPGTKEWTHHTPLPGGDLGEPREAFIMRMQAQHAFMPPELAGYYAGQYGTRMGMVVGHARTMNDLGEHFGSLLYEAELLYVKNNEWARTAEDILLRRTPHGLSLNDNQKAAVSSWLKRNEAS